MAAVACRYRSRACSRQRRVAISSNRPSPLIQRNCGASPDDIVLFRRKVPPARNTVIGCHQAAPLDDREEAQRARSFRNDAQPRSGQFTPKPCQSLQPSIELPLERVLGATGGHRLVRGSPHRFSAVTITDSRSVTPGCLFVAVRGERLDSHQFIAQAVAGGCGGVLIEQDKLHTVPDNPNVTRLSRSPIPSLHSDSLHAPPRSARDRRQTPRHRCHRFVRKTSTKDLIAAVFWPTSAMQGAYSRPMET